LSHQRHHDFQRFARAHTLPARLVERARIILGAAQGRNTERIATQLGIARQTVARWRLRFAQYGLAGIEKDAPRSGRPRLILPDKIDEIVSKTTRETPPGATRWSTRTLAQSTRIRPSSVGRIWRAHGLKPHRIATFKLSNDPRFAEKLEDAINLYRNPPQDSLVLSLDEPKNGS
jgi:transposase